MTHTDLIARLRLYGRPMMRGGNHPQSIVCREAADALTAAQERIEALERSLTRMLMAQEGVPLNAIEFAGWVKEARAALDATDNT